MNPNQPWAYWSKVGHIFGGVVPSEYELLVEVALSIGISPEETVGLINAAKTDSDAIKANKNYWDN